MKKPNLGEDNPSETFKTIKEYAENPIVTPIEDDGTWEIDAFDIIIDRVDKLYNLYHKMHQNGHATYAKTIRKHLEIYIKGLEEVEIVEN